MGVATEGFATRRSPATRVRLVAALGLTLLLLVPPGAEAQDPPLEEGFGNWYNTCSFVKRAPNDPIVFPGQAGASHMHDFFGNRSIGPSSTHTSLLKGQSTCTRKANRSSYWTPSLRQSAIPGKRLAAWATALGVKVHYLGSRHDPATVQPFPKGLRIVAGDSRAVEAQDPTRFGWYCASFTESAPMVMSPTPEVCRSDQFLWSRVWFPDCSDGRTDSPDHRSHMAYSQLLAGSRWRTCPESHPIVVPQVRVSARYKWNVALPPVALSSGGLYSLHADFFEAWTGDSLEQMIEQCIRPSVQCNSGNTQTTLASLPLAPADSGASSTASTTASSTTASGARHPLLCRLRRARG